VERRRLARGEIALPRGMSFRLIRAIVGEKREIGGREKVERLGLENDRKVGTELSIVRLIVVPAATRNGL